MNNPFTLNTILKNIFLVFSLIIFCLILGCTSDGSEEIEPLFAEQEQAAGSGELLNRAANDEGPKKDGHEGITIISFQTDKKTYLSYEEVIISAVIDSPEKIDGLNLRVYGIRPYSYNYLDQHKDVDLAAGKNQVILSAKTPYCTSGCGGVYPGPYSLTLDLSKGDHLIASSSLTITLAD